MNTEKFENLSLPLSLSQKWLEALSRGMTEDDWQQDWTTLACVPSNSKGTAEIYAKTPGVWAAQGLVHAARLWAKNQGCDITVEDLLPDASPIESNMLVCRWRGSISDMLRLERSFLNLASYVSGIATQTRKLVWMMEEQSQQLSMAAPRLVSTRKAIPGYRALANLGVALGGGFPHRGNLSSGILIKENHIMAAGGVTPAVKRCRLMAPHGLKVEVEVKNISELEEALAVGAEVIMLDNFSPDQVKEAVGILRGQSAKAQIEVSGGIHEGNIGDYVLPGVDVISSGALTHTVRPMDLSLLLK